MIGNIHLLILLGLEKKARVNDKIEKFSVIKALQAMDKANVILVVIDASMGLVEQDMRLLRFATESNKSLLIVVNKCDSLDQDDRKLFQRELKAPVAIY